MFAVSKDAQIFAAICDEAQTPLSYKASLQAKRGDWDAVVRTKVRPQDYPSAACYLRDAQVISFLKKYPTLPIKADPKKAAVDSFFAAEKQCYLANERLNPLIEDPRFYGERIAEILRLWRKEIKNVLRKAPALTDIEPRFGPGSTFGNSGNLITVPDKLDTNFSATSPALKALAPVWDQTAWARYAASGLEHVVSHDYNDMRAFVLNESVQATYPVREFTL